MMHNPDTIELDRNNTIHNEEQSIKTIYLPSSSSSLPKKSKKTDSQPKKQRVITHTKFWKNRMENNDYAIETHLELLLNILSGDSISIKESLSSMPKLELITREIKRKIDGYRTQDQEKNKYNPITFVDLSFVVDRLVQSKLQCFYCKQSVSVLYNTVREPSQWTLERIYNNQGHNRTNVEIACLSCNIKRRTMYHEKYRFTKQICFEKETESNIQPSDIAT
jgi:hypothetical protein